MGGGMTFVDLIDGWNCLLPDWWIIYSIWLVLLLLALFAALFLIRYDQEHESLYKVYLLKHKILYDLAINIIIVWYHYQAYQECRGLSDCLKLYQKGHWLRCLQFWGFPLSTLLFFWMRHGVFQEVGTSKTEGSN